MPTKQFSYVLFGTAGVIVLVYMAAQQDSTGQPAGAPPPAPVEIAAPSMPDTETRFLAIIDQGRGDYASGPNDMAKGASRPRRARALCQALPGQVAVDWIGTVETLSSTSEGKGVLTIRLGSHVTVGTSNNSLSDSLTSMHTLIEPDSEVFAVASSLRIGQPVRFSGPFATSNTDCLEEGSLTQQGSMTDPEFRILFAEVKPAG